MRSVGVLADPGRGFGEVRRRFRLRVPEPGAGCPGAGCRVPGCRVVRRRFRSRAPAPDTALVDVVDLRDHVDFVDLTNIAYTSVP